MNPEGHQEYWQSRGEGADDAPLGNVPMEAPAVFEEEASESQDPTISWQASEYIHHEKHVLWFAGLIGGTIVLMIVAFFVIKSLTFTVLLAVMAAAVIAIASRPPRVLQYRLNHHSLVIDEKHFILHDFRAFGLVQDGSFYSITLIPHKRFMPAVNVYFPPEQGEQIVDVFGAVLPMEHAEPDILDRLARKLRF